MTQVKHIVEEALQKFEAPDIVLVLDVDYTLTYPDHPACYYSNISKYKDAYKALMKALTPVQKDGVITLMTQKIPNKLIEADSPKILDDINKNGVKTMVLTAILSGKVLGMKQKLVTKRRDDLQKLGLDFTQSFKHITTVNPLTDMTRYAGDHPIFYHGVMSSNGEGKYNKGEVFVNFLKKIGLTKHIGKPGYVPKCIIFMDDKKSNLEDMEKALSGTDSKPAFIGVHYTGALLVKPSKEITEEEFKEFWQGLINDPKVKNIKA